MHYPVLGEKLGWNRGRLSATVPTATSMLHPSKKFHQNPLITFWDILCTDAQTDTQTATNTEPPWWGNEHTQLDNKWQTSHIAERCCPSRRESSQLWRLSMNSSYDCRFSIMCCRRASRSRAAASRRNSFNNADESCVTSTLCRRVPTPRSVAT